MGQRFLNLLNSLRSSLWILGVLTGLLIAGSFVMTSLPEYASINDLPLFLWMTRSSPHATWWLWASVIVLGALAINTLFCSAQALITKRPGVRWPLVLSPQIIHAGLLFMLLAHVVSSWGSYKGVARAPEGATLAINDQLSVKVKAIDVDISPEGYPLDWKADIEFLRAGSLPKADFLAPNRPAFIDGYGIYLKTIEPDPVLSAVLEVHRDPGAIWALIGGVLFTLGTVLLFRLKIMRER